MCWLLSCPCSVVAPDLALRQVRVGFKWGDAFNPNKKSTQSTLLFERACVLYNLGAHESRSASEEDRSTEAVRLASFCFVFVLFYFFHPIFSLPPFFSPLSPSMLRMAIVNGTEFCW